VDLATTGATGFDTRRRHLKNFVTKLGNRRRHILDWFLAAQKYSRDVTIGHFFNQQPCLDECHWAHVISDIKDVNYFIPSLTCTSEFQYES